MRLSAQCLLRVSAAIDFVPSSSPVTSQQIQSLQDFLSSTQRLLVLTGAGVSTESGIPDYRSEGVGLYARTKHKPIQYQEFVRSAKARQRYWARNYVGWPQFAAFQPNATHKALSEWEKQNRLEWLVTQNVDALHYKAGSRKVTELHGSTHRIMCLSCDLNLSRWELQTIFRDLNPQWDHQSNAIAPDGDVLLDDEQVKTFKVPSCPGCGGVIKPQVIFFGDNVNKNIVNDLFKRVELCDSMLIAGSSLFVYSGYRFVQRAADLGKSIAIVNIGETRADHLANLKLQAKCGDIIPQIQLI